MARRGPREHGETRKRFCLLRMDHCGAALEGSVRSRSTGLVIERTGTAACPPRRATPITPTSCAAAFPRSPPHPATAASRSSAAREGDIEHFTVSSRWDSLASIKRFAGNDYLRARYFPEDDEYLLEREPNVTHYELFLVDPAK